MLHGVSEDPELNVQRRARNQAEVEAAGVELIGLEARRKVLEEQIAKLADQAKSDTGDDPVLNELERAVNLRTKVYSQLRALMANGKVGEANVNEAELNLVAAKTELAKYRRASGEAGNDRLGELRRRLDDTAIELAEVAAKQKGLLELGQKMNFSGEMEETRMRVQETERELFSVRNELTDLDAKLRDYVPPSVTILSTQ